MEGQRRFLIVLANSAGGRCVMIDVVARDALLENHCDFYSFYLLLRTCTTNKQSNHVILEKLQDFDRNCKAYLITNQTK